MVGIIPMAEETEWQRIRRVHPYVQASLAACGLYWRGAGDCWTISEENRQRLIGYLEQRDAYERRFDEVLGKTRYRSATPAEEAQDIARERIYGE